MGDDVQTFKAGVMEIGDLYVINKTDLPGGDRLEQEVQAMLSMASRADAWRPPIVKAIATTGSGVGEVKQALEQFRSFQEQNAWKEKRRRGYLRSRFLELLRRELLEKVIRERLSEGALEQLVDDLLQHRADPYSLVEKIVSQAVASG
jgi:LAO/AO transport system kinase